MHSADAFRNPKINMSLTQSVYHQLAIRLNDLPEHRKLTHFAHLFQDLGLLQGLLVTDSSDLRSGFYYSKTGLRRHSTSNTISSINTSLHYSANTVAITVFSLIHLGGMVHASLSVFHGKSLHLILERWGRMMENLLYSTNQARDEVENTSYG